MTGALMAKAQEDTAFFRHVRCLAHCEVGGSPGEAAWTPAQFGKWLAGRRGRDLTLTSSHDTKRAEDARARLLAMTHLPEAFAEVLEASKGVPLAVPPAHRWYVVQSLLAVWEAGRGDIPGRLALHVEKALREAREVTTWAHPREAAEARTEDFARALAADWARALPPGARALMALGDELSLSQVALKMVMPGVPDLYQGAEGPLHHLTDPDNRLPVAWDAAPAAGLGARKGDLTRRLLRLRAENPAFFAGAATRVEGEGPSWRLVREGPEGRLVLSLGAGPSSFQWTPA